MNGAADAVGLQLAAPGVTSTSWAGSAGRAEAAVAVIRVCPGPASALGERCSPALVELGEDVVKKEQRRRGTAFGQERSFGEDQREDGQALFALRAEAAQVAVVGR